MYNIEEYLYVCLCVCAIKRSWYVAFDVDSLQEVLSIIFA